MAVIYSSKGKSSTWTLYVLKLEDGCYYVGISENSWKRIQQHFKGDGARFTKAHKPIKVMECIDLGACSSKVAKEKERQMVLKYSVTYGTDKVRGAGFTRSY